MADKCDKILGQWKNSIPPDAPKQDVERVLDVHFPGAYREERGTSHELIVEHPCLEKAADYGFSTKYIGGNLSLPIKNGRRVKAIYIRRLLRALELKHKYDIDQAEGDGHGH